MRLDQNWFLETISGQRNSVAAVLTRLLLHPLSLVYRLVIGIRNWAYDNGFKRVHQVQVPVISVGNLTTGGTGKTPFVIWLANRISKHRSVVVISRGYGAIDGELNDEGREIEICCQNVDQLQNPDRVAAAQSVDRNDRSVIVLDDGFQHRRLNRDLDIVLVDALNPFGYGFPLPRGLLREPISSIRRSDIVLLTRSNLVSSDTRQQIRDRLSDFHEDLVWAEAQLLVTGWRGVTGDHHEVNWLADQKLFVFSAIGNPSAFLETLQHQELNTVGRVFFNDHHRFTTQDLRLIVSEAKSAHADAIVCTLKDFVKIPDDLETELPLYALTTEMQIIAGAEQLDQKIRSVLSELENAG